MTALEQELREAVRERALEIAWEVHGHLTADTDSTYSELIPDLVKGCPVLFIADWKGPLGGAFSRLGNCGLRCEHPASLLVEEVCCKGIGCGVWVAAYRVDADLPIKLISVGLGGATKEHTIKNPKGLTAGIPCRISGRALRAPGIPTFRDLLMRAESLADLNEMLGNEGIVSQFQMNRGVRELAKLAQDATRSLFDVTSNVPVAARTALNYLFDEDLKSAATVFDRIVDYRVHRFPMGGLSLEEAAAAVCFISACRGIAESLRASCSCDFTEPSLPAEFWEKKDLDVTFAKGIASAIHWNTVLGGDPSRLDESAWLSLTANTRVRAEWVSLRWAIESGWLISNWPAIEAQLRRFDVKEAARKAAAHLGLMAEMLAWNAA